MGSYLGCFTFTPGMFSTKDKDAQLPSVGVSINETSDKSARDPHLFLFSCASNHRDIVLCANITCKNKHDIHSNNKHQHLDSTCPDISVFLRIKFMLINV